MRKIIICCGDDIQNKNNFVSKLQRESGEYNFAALHDLKPFQNWIMAENSRDIENAFYNFEDKNLLINVNFLHEVLSEIRIKGQINIFKKELPKFSGGNKDLEFLKLCFKKYKPLDLIQKKPNNK